MECEICFNTLNQKYPFYSYFDCTHNGSICGLCLLKSSIFASKTACSFCNQGLKKIYLSAKPIDAAHLEEFKLIGRYEGYHYRTKGEQMFFERMTLPHCFHCQKMAPFATLRQLQTHMLEYHSSYFCVCCAENMSKFCPEYKYFVSLQGLKAHKKYAHKNCKLCNVLLFDDSVFKKHIIEKHCYCIYCFRKAPEKSYFFNRTHLKDHFKFNHYICEFGDCVNNIDFKIFQRKLDYQRHVLGSHKELLTQTQRQEFSKVSHSNIDNAIENIHENLESAPAVTVEEQNLTQPAMTNVGPPPDPVRDAVRERPRSFSQLNVELDKNTKDHYALCCSIIRRYVVGSGKFDLFFDSFEKLYTAATDEATIKSLYIDMCRKTVGESKYIIESEKLDMVFLDNYIERSFKTKSISALEELLKVHRVCQLACSYSPRETKAIRTLNGNLEYIQGIISKREMGIDSVQTVFKKCKDIIKKNLNSTNVNILECFKFGNSLKRLKDYTGKVFLNFNKQVTVKLNSIFNIQKDEISNTKILIVYYVIACGYLKSKSNKMALKLVNNY
eukprot:GAHX01000913.1.p1 GENE.GAHX01000913.1~~GAHX01000913.1.p1  ORF type:complete len:567 (-),score=94.93 GAHX01000913.1:1877-3541(-)